jgi:two-component system phosphate regulon sensor histidine kinase PhoR
VLLAWLRDGDTARPGSAALWGDVRAVGPIGSVTEGTLLDSEARLQEFLAAIQASPNGVVLLDAAGRIEWCNQTAASHFGFDPRATCCSCRQPGARPGLCRLPGSRRLHHDVVIPGPTSSSSRPVRLSVHLHRYGEGRRLMMSRDVTALEQAEAMRRDFVANVSHEIRTPLTVLSGFVETLQHLPLERPAAALPGPDGAAGAPHADAGQ